MANDLTTCATGNDDLAEIQSKIRTLRDIPVMLDRDLAEMYRVELRTFNQAVRRNLERFPDNFMFEVDKNEIIPLITNCDLLAKSRPETISGLLENLRKATKSSVTYG